MMLVIRGGISYSDFDDSPCAASASITGIGDDRGAKTRWRNREGGIIVPNREMEPRKIRSRYAPTNDTVADGESTKVMAGPLRPRADPSSKESRKRFCPWIGRYVDSIWGSSIGKGRL
jgi:hypothetical protein